MDKEHLAHEHPSTLLAEAITILEQVKEDFLDYANIVADNEYDVNKHHLCAYEVECAIKILKLAQ